MHFLIEIFELFLDCCFCDFTPSPGQDDLDVNLRNEIYIFSLSVSFEFEVQKKKKNSFQKS